MADGSAKAIEDVRPGDKVKATDPESGETRKETVARTIKGKGVKNLVRVTVDVDGAQGSKPATVVATDGHPFWVPELGEWIAATDLRSGQWLQTSAGTWVQVRAVHRFTKRATVHNLTVSTIHTYHVLAGNMSVLVHNCAVENKSHNSYSYQDGDSLIVGELDNNGSLSLLVNAPKDGPIRGYQMFDKVMEHFGDQVNAIHGNFIDDNRATFNRLTAGGFDHFSAAAGTWTGQQARRYGFNSVQAVTAVGSVGQYSKIRAVFGR